MQFNIVKVKWTQQAKYQNWMQVKYASLQVMWNFALQQLSMCLQHKLHFCTLHIQACKQSRVVVVVVRYLLEVPLFPFTSRWWFTTKVELAPYFDVKCENCKPPLKASKSQAGGFSNATTLTLTVLYRICSLKPTALSVLFDEHVTLKPVGPIFSSQ